jgi:hypothetical protein
MSENVDLSLAKPGDICHREDGVSFPFIGLHRSCRYAAGEMTFSKHGRCCSDPGCWCHIVRVTRNGVQVTPAPAEPAAEVARYFDGLEVQVGDACRLHVTQATDLKKNLGDPLIVSEIDSDLVPLHFLSFDNGQAGWLSARFELVSRSVPTPSEEAEAFNVLWDQKQKCLEKIQAIREHDYTVGESALPKVADALESVVDYAAHVFDHITQSA